MVLAQPVVGANGAVLLDQGARVTEHLLGLLDQWGVLWVVVERPEDEGRITESGARARRKAVVYAFHENARKVTEELVSRIKRRRGDLPKEKIRDLAVKLVDEAIASREILAGLVTIRSYDNYLFSHAIHCSILSILLGVTMDLESKTLRALAEGCLLQDVGMAIVPRDIWDKESGLTQDDFLEIQKHPIFGVEIAAPAIEENPEIEKIIYQHHERLDGSGYPKGVPENRIHPLARIAAVADVYCAMQSDRKYRKRFLPYFAMQELLSAQSVQLDGNVVRALVRILSVYPLGSFVRLSDGAIAVVLYGNEKAPLRPVVKLARTPDDETILHGEVVDLMEDARFIKEAVDPEPLGLEAWKHF